MHSKTYLHEELGKFDKHGFIEPCHSTYSAPAMLVPKQNGKLRLVIDYLQLTKQINKSCWPIPSIEEILYTLEGSCYFSTNDMYWGFIKSLRRNQVRTIQGSVHHLDFFRSLCMPMGLTGTPNTFQRFMKKVLVGLTCNFTILYSDDCVTFSRTIEEQPESLRAVYQRFKDANARIIATKFEFFQQKLLYLGHVLSREGIQADLEKTSTVNKYPVAKIATEVKSFFCSYCRRYVNAVIKITRPLHQLT